MALTNSEQDWLTHLFAIDVGMHVESTDTELRLGWRCPDKTCTRLNAYVGSALDRSSVYSPDVMDEWFARTREYLVRHPHVHPPDDT